MRHERDLCFLERILTRAYTGLWRVGSKENHGTRVQVTHRLACFPKAGAPSVLQAFQAPVGWGLRAQEQGRIQRGKKKYPRLLERT